MKIRSFRSAGLAVLVVLAGCATQPRLQPGVEVTRFHLAEHPIARGEISVEPIDPAEAGTLQFSQIAAAVGRELSEQGWRVVRDGRSEQIAFIDLEQGSREAMASRPAVSVGVGGGTGGWGRSGVGVGVGASFPVGARRPNEIVVTELTIRLQRRSDATAFWEGRAEVEAHPGTPLANPIAAADTLADAMFQGFPGESGRTIRVR